MLIKKASPGLDQRNRLGYLLGPEYVIVDYDGGRPLADQVSEADVLLVRDVSVGADVITAAKQLKLIQRPGAHIVGLDYEAAKARGVYVSRFPSRVMGQPARDVAEHAMFLMLALAKKFRESQDVVETGRVGLPKTVRIDGKTLGLVGIGNTGIELARLAQGLGMNVIAVKQTRDDALAKHLDLEFLGDKSDLETMLGRADVVSLHLPNNSSTHKFMGEREFSMMKPGALILNISRAPIIDKDALYKALKSGRIGGAGLDVWWSEPADPNDELLYLPNLIFTPHIAGDTEEFEHKIAELTAANIVRVNRGEKPHFIVGLDLERL